MRFFLERKGTEISLLPPISQGGEGSIHPITGEPGLVAKVFTQPSPERAEKLKAMMDDPPIVGGGTPVLFAWPMDRLLTESGECVGYVMPYARHKVTLSTIYDTSTRPRWADHAFLLRTAKNVAVAVSTLHRHGYVVGDLKGENLLVGPDASVAVVDTDSVQVRTTGLVFRCEVGTDDFTPPELLAAGLAYREFDRHPHHDCFGLGVLIFRLLMEGNHPFAARYIGSGARPPLKERIIQGHWPYCNNRTGAVLPRRQAPPFESLSPHVQRLMRECFEAGHKNPASRPTADEWVQVLDQAEEEWKKIRTKLRFFYHRAVNFPAWGQSFMTVPERLWSAVARVPRKVWITVACVLAILVLFFALARWPRTTESVRPGEIGAPTTHRVEPQGEGEETPWLWQEAQRLNRLKK
jgi:DNA-binding helix-hairpin-helix protein with protein kinase domain